MIYLVHEYNQYYTSSFCLHALRGEGSIVSLKSYGAYTGIATLYAGIADIGVTKMGVTTPTIFVLGGLSLITERYGSKGF